MAALTPGLGRAFLRLFAVQGSWNYERMLGVGMGVAEEPLVRALAGRDGAAYRAAMGRGARFFNAHPYLAGLAVGATARAEMDGAPPEQIERMRAALCGPLGSLGDRLVWAGWLPFTSALALTAIALGAGWAAVVAFLVVYNAGHLGLRWWALRAGWAHGVRVAAALHAPGLQRAGTLVAPAMAFAAGLALPAAALMLAPVVPAWARAVMAGTAVLGFALLLWRRALVDGLRLGLAAAALALLVGWVRW